jgi:DNA-binding XRE family transcriptional regulator
MKFETWDGRLIAAARALAGLTVEQLAAAAEVGEKTIRRIEHRKEDGTWDVSVAPKLRHGHVSRETWERIVAALERHGVELHPAKDGQGAGVRWKAQPKD